MRALSTVKYPRANLLPEGEGIPLLFLAIFFIFFAAALVLVNFVLQFLPPEAEVTVMPEPPEQPERPPAAPPAEGGDDTPKVVSLDQFRKK